MRIAIITAGGAGMFCGSCMQDNTLARSLRMAGADALLLPTYTPIRVDEADVSGGRVFLGGINVYLDSKLPGWRFLPRTMKRWLDRPGLVKLLSKLSSSTNASDLGPLTIDLLRGSHGPQRKEIEELIQYLCEDLRPDVILFSNALLSGIVPELRRRFAGKIVCLLQGDDIFLDGLPEPWKSRAISLVGENAAHFDGLLTHSRYYSGFMHAYLNLPANQFRNIPLTIELPPATSSSDTIVHQNSNERSAGLTVGYFARICPEKGAFRFLEAAQRVLSQRPDLHFVIGGFLPEQHHKSFEQRLQTLQKSHNDRITWAGSPATREAKFALLRSFDWLCVPTEYREPKGLYVLEAALVGVPSLLPSHGAFPERIATLGSGQLYDPAVPDALETALLELRKHPEENRRRPLDQRCLNVHGMVETGHQVLDVIRSL
jgi:glycosyltransferase involved in cell wall biosynthesis